MIYYIQIHTQPPIRFKADLKTQKQAIAIAEAIAKAHDEPQWDIEPEKGVGYARKRYA